MNRNAEYSAATGVVIQLMPQTCRLHTADGEIDCPLPADELAVGDEVEYIHRSGTAAIQSVLPRRSLLARRAAGSDAGASARSQAIAANVDLLVAVFAAANPAPRWNMLDRYLVTAEAGELPALICITKCDLAGEDEELAAEVETYRRIGYPVALTSAASGQGLDELAERLAGQTAVLVGKSGAGKSSLLNALHARLGWRAQEGTIRVSEVSRATGKGRHTTTGVRLYPLAGGGAVIDTPGAREFGLWDVDPAGLDGLFPEMRPFLGACRFGLDCAHDEEPGCAVRRAVMDGHINPRRYQSYLRLWEG